jgi:hypothetical protein
VRYPQPKRAPDALAREDGSEPTADSERPEALTKAAPGRQAGCRLALAKPAGASNLRGVTPSSSTFRKAAEIQERIERLQQELATLLQTGEAAEGAPSQPKNEPPSEPASGRRRKAAPAVAASRGRGGRRGSPSGPLAPAVVQVLKAKGKAMSVSEILDGLRSRGYQYPSADPKKNLFARIYRLKGVKQVGPGQFAAG